MILILLRKITGLDMELKGGISLSKAFNVTHRFSEDIDIKIIPMKLRLVLKSIQAKTMISQNTEIVRRTILIGWPRN